jgi:uncharacterized damage-inducible protein DinB
MYGTISGFLADWKQESAATLKIMNALTDESLRQMVSPEGRSLGTVAWHIVASLGEMGSRAGLAPQPGAADPAEPATGAEIASRYEMAAGAVGERVRELWTDATLGNTLELYGRTWTRAGVLASLVKHQIHHRGQMTVLMRQAGIAVPGIYGPAREEWASMGMPPKK